MDRRLEAALDAFRHGLAVNADAPPCDGRYAEPFRPLTPPSSQKAALNAASCSRSRPALGYNCHQYLMASTPSKGGPNSPRATMRRTHS